MIQILLEHIKTMYHFVSHTENPYMQIKCRFKGKNAWWSSYRNMGRKKSMIKQKIYTM